MRISDWSSDVCSSDLLHHRRIDLPQPDRVVEIGAERGEANPARIDAGLIEQEQEHRVIGIAERRDPDRLAGEILHRGDRSEEHTSELQSLMSSSYAVFSMKKTKKQIR